MRKWLKLRALFLLMILFALNGCAGGLIQPTLSPTLAPQIVFSSYCKLAKPISYDSAKDSPATVRQIEAHNSKWVCQCEGDCPASASGTK